MPANLAAITPSYMGFEVLTPLVESEMHAGQIIAYRVKPLLGISMNWITEITHVVPGKYFVDEQRAGPYAFWHHLHRLKIENGQTVMTDLVHYILPFGFVSEIANGLVEKRLKEIFDFRFRVLEEKFASPHMR